MTATDFKKSSKDSSLSPVCRNSKLCIAEHLFDVNGILDKSGSKQCCIEKANGVTNPYNQRSQTSAGATSSSLPSFLSFEDERLVSVG